MCALRIVFMGTPLFAVASLRLLVEADCNVVAVVTAPDAPRRGRKPVFSPVKRYALEKGVAVLQPRRLKAPAFVEELRAFGADLQVVVAFRMLPEVVWAMPARGTFNLHASLLPAYRGAAPIAWALIHGERETGVTTFFIDRDIDTGPLLFQEREPIYDYDDAGTLHDRLMLRGAQLTLKTVKAIAAGAPPTVPQRAGPSEKAAPKLFTRHCEIDWNRTVREVINFIRGLSPYPGAWTTLGGQVIKVYKAGAASPPLAATHNRRVATDQARYLGVRAADGWVRIDDLQVSGGRRMTVAAFFRGHTLNDLTL